VPKYPGIFRKAPHGALFVSASLVSMLVALFLGFSTQLAAGPRNEPAVVRHVIDGDSVVLTDNRPVRLIGINTPELGKDGAPHEPFAVAARDRLSELVQGRPVELVFEAEDRDRHGRWLAHLVMKNGGSVEIALLDAGLAFAVAIPPNIGEQTRHQAAEARARLARRGIWNDPYYAPRDPTRLTAADTGFRRVHGRVSHVGRSRKYVYLDMGPRFALRIRHTDWAQYFHGRPESWRDAVLEARGWIADHDGRLHMTIGHPAMIERRHAR